MTGKNTEVIRIRQEQPDMEALQRAGDIIKKGGLVAFPTETVYGLGADALNEDAARLIYEAKGRPSDNPLIVHICRMSSLEKIVEFIPEEARMLAEAFWPGPLTMVFYKKPLVPKTTTGGLDTVAVRFPSDTLAAEFIKASGGFVAAPSANISGRPSPTSGKYVIQDMMGRVDMIIVGDDSYIGLESTIVDVTVHPPMILRPGRITGEMLEMVVGEVVLDPGIAGSGREPGAETAPPKAPGMKYRHYAPRGELILIDGSRDAAVEYICSRLQQEKKDGRITGVICANDTAKLYTADLVSPLGDRDNREELSRSLYRVLREMDDKGVEIILSEVFGESKDGDALMNRLMKAAGYRVVRL